MQAQSPQAPGRGPTSSQELEFREWWTFRAVGTDYTRIATSGRSVDGSLGITAEGSQASGWDQLSNKKAGPQKKVDVGKETYKLMLDELKAVQEATIDKEQQQLTAQSKFLLCTPSGHGP